MTLIHAISGRNAGAASRASGAGADLLDRLCTVNATPLDMPVTLIAAHPDDDVIGAGTRLTRLRRARIVFVTDGAPADERFAAAAGFASRTSYAAARREEALAALAEVGIGDDRVTWLGFADQGVTSAALDVALALARDLAQTPPAVVLTHPYEGGHPDHDATALATELACKLIRSPASRLEFSSYHADAGGVRRSAAFLPGTEPGRLVLLDETAQALRRRLFAAHRSQAAVLCLFETDRERSRLAPNVDFMQPPAPWPPLYAGFGWGVDWPDWRRQAAPAISRLAGLTT